MGDKVMKPRDVNRKPATVTKQVKSGIIEGPTATTENLIPFNRKGKK